MSSCQQTYFKNKQQFYANVSEELSQIKPEICRHLVDSTTNRIRVVIIIIVVKIPAQNHIQIASYRIAKRDWEKEKKKNQASSQ